MTAMAQRHKPARVVDRMQPPWDGVLDMQALSREPHVPTVLARIPVSLQHALPYFGPVRPTASQANAARPAIVLLATRCPADNASPESLRAYRDQLVTCYLSYFRKRQRHVPQNRKLLRRPDWLTANLFPRRTK